MSEPAINTCTTMETGRAQSGQIGRFPIIRPAINFQDELKYNMNQKTRKAYIFNHFSFTHDSLPDRIGTEQDVKRLKEILPLFRFDVTVHEDLTLPELLMTLENLKRENHNDCECLAIFILTHGKFNKLAAKNFYYHPEVIWNNFASKECPTMAGKPKLIFINACRGDQLDFGIEFTSDVVTDGPEDENRTPMYVLPTHADILLAYSTVERYISIRDEVDGTWFIQSLCEVLMETRCENMEIKQILTRVSYRVSSMTSKGTIKQVPTIVSTFIRDLYLS